MIKSKNFFLVVIPLIILIILTPSSFACTRVLITSDTQATLVGRNMDWFQNLPANLWIYPQGITREGLEKGYAVKWVSKYASIVATVYDDIKPIATDGMNERGLAAHLLALSESNYGQRNEQIPGMSVLLWAQFYLDNFESVTEAVRFTQTNSFQLIPFFDQKIKQWVNLHLALEDASGDSAVIEYMNGSPHIYHNSTFKVLTNSPTFDQQLENLKRYQGFGGDKPLPGTTIPADRFVRATYYANHLPKAETLNDEVIELESVMQNASQPFGVPSSERPKISQTLWRVIADLTHQVYYFKSVTSFNMVWADLNKFNLHPNAPMMKLEVNNSDLAGDVSKDFKPVSGSLDVADHQ